MVEEDTTAVNYPSLKLPNIDEELEQTQEKPEETSEKFQDLDASSCSDSSTKTLCHSEQVDEEQEYTDESEHDAEQKLPAKVKARRASNRTASRAELKKISKIMTPKKK